MKYALIGCGRVAANHLRAAYENGLEIAAVCDIAADHIDGLFARAPYLEAPGAIRRYADYNELFEKERPELVSVALPSGLHAACAMRAVEQGCNVIVEKPVALSLADADALIALAEKRGVKVCACHQNRFNAAVLEMRSYIERGCFGKLSHGAVTVRWSRGRDYYASDDWRGRLDMDGGALMNQSIHGIDLLRWMCGGKLQTVYGCTRRAFHPYIEAEDLGMAVLTFKNGCVATVEGTVNLYGHNLEEHLMLVGETGAMKLGGTSANTVAYRCFEAEGAPVEDGLVEHTPNVYGNGHTPLFADMIDAVKNDRPPFVTAQDGRDALETVLAIYLSAKTGQPVKLPLTDVACADFAGLFD